MTDRVVDLNALAEISGRMNLRKPNQQAVYSIATALYAYYNQERGEPPMESLVVSATGVGKTYILAATIEYMARVEGIRNFAVITPGRTILNKTVANFTPGHPKSMLHIMETAPVVITADNFDSPAMRAAMDDPMQVKLYIFTVQSLTKPTTQLGRRTHEFREGLGEAFYEHLHGLDDLFIFADEHHCYFSPAFSRTIRELEPYALIGLTATPHPNTRDEDMIFKYPLSAAVAEKLVKTPVIVGRRDDRRDPYTQLTDGARLLELKARAISIWCSANQLQPIHPVMLVVAQSINEANEYAQYMESTTFMDGRFAGAILTVHSNAPDDALEKLETVEEPNSPIRIIISVGMLKEGWDVKNVYVLASMRASVSDILTEQTLGRGLRLPFGQYTGEEMLDTLEVLAHERYDDLLRRTGLMNEQLRDHRVQMLMHRDESGNTVVRRDESQGPLPDQPWQAQRPVADIPERAKESEHAWDTSPSGETTTNETTDTKGSGSYSKGSGFAIVDTDTRLEESQRIVETVRDMQPNPSLPRIELPVVKMIPVPVPFSLADITDVEPFRALGRNLARDPEETLRRKRVEATIEIDTSGLRHTKVLIRDAAETVYVQPSFLPSEDIADELVSAVVHCEAVVERESEIRSARRLVDEMMDAMGGSAVTVLSAYLETAKAKLVQLVTKEASRLARPPMENTTVRVRPFMPVRQTRLDATEDKYGAFEKGRAYAGWRKSLYEQVWFDSSPERDMANLLDESQDIVAWVRLHTNDLPILWSGEDLRRYNPDFIAIDTDNIHWIVEVKADRDMQASEVRAKMEAAKRWANHASASEHVSVRWRYILASEDTLRNAHGSWRNVLALA